MLNPAWNLVNAQALTRQVGRGTRPPRVQGGDRGPSWGWTAFLTPFGTELLPRDGALSAVFLSTTPALPEPLPGTCGQRPHPGTPSPNARLQEIIHRNDGAESLCTERDGWCLPKTSDDLRDVMSLMIRHTIRSKRPGECAGAGKPGCSGPLWGPSKCP